MALIDDPNLIGEWLNWPADKISQNATALERVRQAASSSIVRKTGRAFVPDNGATREFSIRFSKTQLNTGDIRTATLVETNTFWGGADEWETLPATAYRLGRYRSDWPFQYITRIDGRYFHRGRVRITGDWEWEEVPDTAQQATIMEAAKLLARAGSPKQVGSSFAGTETNLADFMDLDIEELISDLRVPDVG